MLRNLTLFLNEGFGCTSQEVAGSIPYIVLAQFRLELTKLSCLCLVNPLTNAHLPVPVPLGLGCSSARASGYGSVIDHRPDVKLGF